MTSLQHKLRSSPRSTVSSSPRSTVSSSPRSTVSSSRKKIICFSIVSPSGGKLKKFRVSFYNFLGATVFSALLVVFLFALATDYGRINLLRLQESLSFEKVAEENLKLSSLNDSLQKQVERLKSSRIQTVHYERDLRAHLEQLTAIVGNARSLGLVDSRQLQRLEPVRNEKRGRGMGGAEIDCADASSQCRNLFAEKAYDDVATIIEEAKPDQVLLRKIGMYLDVLRTMPLGVPARGEITSSFGYRESPFGGGIKVHEGIDVSFPYGSPVYSTADGKVLDVRRDGTYGLMMDVQHSKKVISRYAHLSKALVTTGDRVARGEVLGFGGSSGRSTGPHLHYEVRIGGKPVDPMRFFRLAEKLETFL